VYRCRCCGQLSITLWQKAWACHRLRFVTCRSCGASVGISATSFYLTNAPALLYIVGLYLYTDLVAPIRTNLTFWLVTASILVVPMIYFLLATAMRMWLVRLIRR